MTFKQDAVKRVVTGTFQRPDGVPSQGKIYVQLSGQVRGRQENTLYTTQQVEIELDSAGSFSKELSVTAPGLTIEELEELNTLQAQREQNLEDLADVSESINAYLQKLASNQAVTPTETAQYNTDLATKQDLQSVSIELTKNYLEILDKQKNLEDNVVRMKVRFDLTNPKDNSKIEFVLPPGTTPIDIADLPKV